MCTPLLTNDHRGALESSPGLTLDAKYHVVSLLAYPAGRVQLQLVADDDHSLAWFDSNAFITVDGTVPESWEARIREDGTVEFAPSSWLVPGFWEDYYDGDPAAAETVKTELAKIMGTSREPGLSDLSAPMTSRELQTAAEQLATARRTDPWKGLMLVLLRFIKDISVPKELQPVLDRVDEYWTMGMGTPDTLKTAKASCRDYLDAFETHTHLDNPETRFALAILCTLEPLGDEDAKSDTAEWFAGVVWDSW